MHRTACTLTENKSTRPPAPWLNNDEIRHLQNCRNKLRKEAHSTGSDKAWQLFRDARNKLKTLIRHAKMCFYRKALSSNKPRKVWKIIHRIIKPSYKPLHFDVEKLNKFFAEIPTRTISNCECITLDQLNSEGLPERVPIDEQFTLKAVSRVDILNTTKSLKSDCSTGPDHIPVQFIKLAVDQLADPLTVIINNCVANSQFPQIWKLARISPIPKNDSPSSEEELRPISILPALSKIFEKVVAKQIVEFIETNNLLPESMGGFRKGHSTATVLMG